MNTDTITQHTQPLTDLFARSLSSSEDREQWLADRRGGITATEVKKLHHGGARARMEIVKEKREGKSVDLTGNRYIDRGNQREPIIADWILRRFNILPNTVLFHAVLDSRHMATPDGCGVNHDGLLVLSEIKTSKFDLNPAIVGGKFYEMGYDLQVQWQLHVGGAERLLFVWEQHDDNWPNPQPLALEPQFVWIERDEKVIAELIAAADAALAELEQTEQPDAADAADYNDLVEDFLWFKGKADYFKEKADAVAEQIKERIGDVESFAIDTELAKISLSTSKPKPKFDESKWKAKAPKAYAAWQSAKSRYVTTPPGVTTLRVTPIKKTDALEGATND